jgi:anthranilate phosphoribosyltransferase
MADHPDHPAADSRVARGSPPLTARSDEGTGAEHDDLPGGTAGAEGRRLRGCAAGQVGYAAYEAVASNPRQALTVTGRASYYERIVRDACQLFTMVIHGQDATP